MDEAEPDSGTVDLTHFEEAHLPTAPASALMSEALGVQLASNEPGFEDATVTTSGQDEPGVRVDRPPSLGSIVGRDGSRISTMQVTALRELDASSHNDNWRVAAVHAAASPPGSPPRPPKGGLFEEYMSAPPTAMPLTNPRGQTKKNRQEPISPSGTSASARPVSLPPQESSAALLQREATRIRALQASPQSAATAATTSTTATPGTPGGGRLAQSAASGHPAGCVS